MNLNATFTSETFSRECELYDHLGGTLDHTTTGANVVLVVLTVVNILTCPFTALLNLLVMIAVKTKARLKSKSNIALGCLALTDLLMGVIGQPVFAANMISILQGDTSDEHCALQQLSRALTRFLCGASIRHLVLISAERYIAINHPFAYTTMVTEARILGSSVLAWITIVLANIPLLIMDNSIFLKINNVILFTFMAAIVYCQVTVYNETRRQEKEIAAQQVSEEARQEFLKKRKAFKITTTLLIVLLLCYSPAIIVRMLVLTSTITSVNIAYIAYSTATFVAVLNSLVNPIIYCVRIREFRVAFIQILMSKNYTQAEQFERRIFGTLDNVAQPEAGQQLEEVQNNTSVCLNTSSTSTNINSVEGSNNSSNHGNNGEINNTSSNHSNSGEGNRNISNHGNNGEGENNISNHSNNGDSNNNSCIHGYSCESNNTSNTNINSGEGNSNSGNHKNSCEGNSNISNHSNSGEENNNSSNHGNSGEGNNTENDNRNSVIISSRS